VPLPGGQRRLRHARTTPPSRSSPGTLAYAVGMGCAVVSTPYPVRRRAARGRPRRALPANDSAALAAELAGLLGDEPARRRCRPGPASTAAP
jgi:hypothetical protein